MTNPKKELANSLENATGVIVKKGEEIVKRNLLENVIAPTFSKNHLQKKIHIHDLEFYSTTYNCIGVRVSDLIGNKSRSFSNALRELARKIVWLTNIQSGGIGFLDFDNDIAPFMEGTSDEAAINDLREFFCDMNVFSRKGCEKPYVTFNFGLSTSDSGRRVSKLILSAYQQGNENGNPFIFPNLVFKLKNEINVDSISPNHDLFLTAISTTAKRMVPTYFNCDSPANKNAPSDKIGIMGCRTRVVTNIYGEESGLNRGNIACVTMNLVQMAFESKGSLEQFKEKIKSAMNDSKELLISRFNKLVEQADFSELRIHRIYKDSEKNDNYEMLKNGTLSIGFIGLWDALSVLHDTEWKSTDDMQAYKEEALDIVKFMRAIVDSYTIETKLNFSLLASAAEGVSGSFAEYDAKNIGKNSAVCEKGYYTNSFHVPVFVDTDYITKIDFEAPFHQLCNGGSITYIEMGEMPFGNIEAVQEIVEYAYNEGCNYIGINFLLDYCNDCSYIGRISNNCPKCSSFNITRLRRVSGYLAEENRFTAGKRKEMKDRKAVKKI